MLVADRMQLNTSFDIEHFDQDVGIVNGRWFI